MDAVALPGLPSSTKANSWEMSQSVRGETVSSTPLKDLSDGLARSKGLKSRQALVDLSFSFGFCAPEAEAVVIAVHALDLSQMTGDMPNCTGTTGDGHFPRNYAVMREVWHPETWSTFVHVHMNLNPSHIFRVTYQVEDDQQSGSSQTSVTKHDQFGISRHFPRQTTA